MWPLNRLSKWPAIFRRAQSGATYIGVTGSSGKSSTVSMLSHICAGLGPVLTTLIHNQYKHHVQTLAAVTSAHKFVVCELGAGGTGSLQPMLNLIKPSVGVVTLVGLEHKSRFRTLEAVAEEKGKLIEALPKDGLAILNRDDPRVLAMASHTRARVVSFGKSEGAYRIVQTRAHSPGELSVTVAHGSETFEIKTQLTGAHNALAVVAAFACAHQLAAPPALILKRIASFKPIFGRCSCHVVKNGPLFVVDTIKAPYYSIYLPIQMMEEFTAPRKRIVVGQISDGNTSERMYRDVYRASRLVADQVIFVGDHAHRSKATAEEISAGRFVEKRSVKEAAEFVKDTAIPGEIILLKSSIALHLERIAINFENEVRCWQQECGKMWDDCLTCGSYGVPFVEYRRRSKKGRKKKFTLSQLRPW